MLGFINQRKMELFWPIFSVVVLLFTLALVLFNYVREKLLLFVKMHMFFVFGKDTKWKSKKIDEKIPENAIVHTKTIIFLRHGESTWNVTFNRSKIFLLPRLIYAILYEAYLYISGVRDSWFYDSPLCDEGIKQSEELREYFEKKSKELKNSNEEPILRSLIGLEGSQKSIIVSSNLRRALSTAAISFYDRVLKTEENITVLSALQEIIPNPDTLSNTPTNIQPTPSWIEKKNPLYIPKIYERKMHISFNKGNKPLSSRGIDRLMEFNEWVANNVSDDQILIVSGHSLWFRSYFREFLPFASNHVAKTKKIQNNALISFKLNIYENPTNKANKVYHIDPESVAPIYKGFTK